MATMRRLLALAGASRRRLALAAVLGALTVVFGVGLMATAGYLITRAAEQPAILSLMTAIVAVRFFGIARPLARYLERLTSHDVALRGLGRIRSRVFERIEPLAPAQLEGYARGDLLSRMVADVDSLQNLHLRGVLPPLVALLAGALSVGAAAAFLPAAALVLAAGLVAGGVGVPVLAGHLVARTRQRQAPARGELSSELVDLLGAAPEIVAYGGEGAALARVRHADRALVRVARRDALVGGLADGLGLVVAGVTVAGVLGLAVGAHAAADLDRVLIAMLALLALASFEAVQPLSAVARELPATLGAGRRVLDLIDREPAVVDPTQPAPPPRPPFAVALEDVRARYGSEEQPALDGVSLRLQPGRRVALLGASGAGKTTVVNLLLRFLDPEQGRLTLGGRDLRDYRQEDVRRLIAVAGQDSHLFSTSIRENVRVARPDASDTEVEQALRRARLWTWIRDLPDGADTLVGELGRELSGGQRQRLVLARALLADAPILVLDEPTAHVDPATAERLMEDILSAACERSVLLITHRPEGLGLVDEIITLDGGSPPVAPGRVDP
jgi:ATP-binding cassette subfamily C protein CydC